MSSGTSDTGAVAGALFEPAGGERYVASALARGPWDPRACHGGPVSALLARAVERADGAAAADGVDWQIARLTIELTRPVPLGAPLEVVTSVERPGRRVSLVAAVLVDGVNEVAKARALRIRRAHVPLPDVAVVPDETFDASPEDARQEQVVDHPDEITFVRDACEFRVARGSWDELGPISVWVRLLVDVVPDEEPTGTQRAAAAADFGNGVSAAIPYEEYLYINPDLTLHLVREPVGEWIGLRAVTHLGEMGAGLAETAVFDTVGRVGRGVQSLFVDPRPAGS